jgi:2-methylcitrate dehydratase PrpD
MTPVTPKSHEPLPAARRLGEFIATRPRSFDLAEPIVLATKRALLDCVAATLSGARDPVVERLKEHHADRLPAQATIVAAFGRRVPAEVAALINGTMGHATDYDDVSFTMWGHATAPVFPAVLAVGESAGLSGAELLRAFLVGLEVEMKLGASVAPHHYGAGWHPTATIGVFGACAGAAAAANLSAEQSSAALCIAASRSAGLRANFGSMTKPLHVGFAARDGLEAAKLAARNITAQNAAIDGAFGFIEVMAGGKSSLDDRLARLGQPFDIIEPGLAYKYYPSCSDTHIATDTLLDLLDAEQIAVPAIEHVRCRVTKGVFDNLIYSDPRSGLEAKFSMQFCLARAMENRRLELADFTDNSVRSPQTRALMQRIDLHVDGSIAEGDYCSPASIEVALKDGRKFTKAGRSARGHPDRPLDDAQLAEKFFACAQVALKRPAAQALYDFINSLEKSPSIEPLAVALAG